MNNSVYLSEISFQKVKDDYYWSKLPFYKELSEGKSLKLQSPVSFIVGENGSGKSTLIEAIAVSIGFNPEGGTINFSFSTNDTHSNLYDYINTAKRAYPKDGYFLRAESFYNTASYIDSVYEFERKMSLDTPYGVSSLHNQSHGESFLSLVQNRFSGNGLYILDEPEAALSPMRQLTLLTEIDRLVKLDSQFIIATHSPILMTLPYAKLYSLDGGIKEVSYKETEHYRVTKSFLEEPERYLKMLL